MTKKCGVNSNLYSAYNFNDHVWTFSGVNADLLYLTSKCVKIDSIYWFKKIGGDHWIPIKSIVDAEKEALNTWQGAYCPSGRLVDSDLIATFFSGNEWLPNPNPKLKAIMTKVGSCPNVSNKMVVPLGPQFITYRGQGYLNTWYNDMLDGNETNLQLGKLVLLMVYGALCNGTINKDDFSAEADRIYNMVVTNNYDNLEFRFLMNWLAAIVQNPGINLQTNLWLIGPVQGLGKGTIVDIMRNILGSEFVGELNQSEIEAGWNDHLVGLQLVEVNEFDTTGKMNGKAWGKWIKGHTVEPTLKIRERNKTSYTVLNISNYIGTSNEVEQTFIDTDDRRNQFIRTTNDTSWVQFATAVQIKYFKPKPKEVSSGFASILEKVTVDLDFIAKAHKNEFRQQIAESAKSYVEEWNENDPSLTRGKWLSSRDLYDQFKTWYRFSNPEAPMPSETAWGRMMGNSSKIGVSKKRAASGSLYLFGTPPEQIVYKLEDSVINVNQITKDTTQIIVYDLDVPEEKSDATMLSPIQKMRALLQQKGDFE
jgi:hypothetical protein